MAVGAAGGDRGEGRWDRAVRDGFRDVRPELGSEARQG